ncbi:MAG: dihydropteroate synthase [Bacteroidota bacterium]|jgi:dihydropteroate synthase
MNKANFTINCSGNLINLTKPMVMGVINITPDSFYEQSRAKDTTAILKRAEQMLMEGADFLDLGAMSSRPGAPLISTQEEWNRLMPPLRAVVKQFPNAIVSVDTIFSETAKMVVSEGASIINDISGGTLDNKMFETIADLKVPYILMHTRGTPETMQQNLQYEDVAMDILDDLIQKVGILRQLGVKDVIIDPGFGFGKTIEQNFILLKKLGIFKILGLPLLAGLSRKTMIWKSLQIAPEQALNGTTALNMVALLNGTNILRVHDVRPAVETIQLYQLLNDE